MISFKNNYDAIVIGGGPAGSSTAALLAEKGHDVLIVEKEKFPRYHVGESLMPFCYFPLERLGLVDTLMESANPRKYCVQFVRQDGFLSQPFYFFQHFDHPSSTTWQVWRSEFDKMIMDKARDNGATVMEKAKAKNLINSADNRVEGVKVISDDLGELELREEIVFRHTSKIGWFAILNSRKLHFGHTSREPRETRGWMKERLPWHTCLTKDGFGISLSAETW